MKHPIFNTNHSDNCYCKNCKKESDKYLKQLEAYKKPLQLDDIKVLLNKKETEEVYNYLKKCLRL